MLMNNILKEMRIFAIPSVFTYLVFAIRT